MLKSLIRLLRQMVKMRRFLKLKTVILKKELILHVKIYDEVINNTFQLKLNTDFFYNFTLVDQIHSQNQFLKFH